MSLAVIPGGARSGKSAFAVEHATNQNRDVLGRVNQRWATASATSLLLVAGKAIELHDPTQILVARSSP